MKLSVYYTMIIRKFLDIIPSSHNIKNFSEYYSVEKPPKKLLEQVKVSSPELASGAWDDRSDVIRLKHYSYKTEKSYVNWIKRYIIFIINGILKKWVEKKLNERDGLGVEPEVALWHSHSKPCWRLSPHTATPGFSVLCFYPINHSNLTFCKMLTGRCIRSGMIW